MALSNSVHIDISGMNCGSCVGRVERALSAVPGVQDARVNLATESAHVAWGNAEQPEVLLHALEAAGYQGQLRNPDGSRVAKDKSKEIQELRFLVMLATVLAAPVFFAEMGGHLYPPIHHWISNTIGARNSHLLQFALTTAVLFGPGFVFFRIGIPALLKGAPDMNALVALGTSAAYLYSSVATFIPALLPAGAVNVYFEAAAVIVVLILFGRLLEARARGRAGEAIAKLIGLTPDTAQVHRDGAWQDIPLAAVMPGDLLLARPGARIAVDGQVTEGRSFVDESMLTGEPIAVEKSTEDKVIAGSVNGTGALQYRASAVGEDTVLARIIAMVEDAQGAKLPIQNRVDRITLWFVPAILGIALVSFALWLVFGPSPSLVPALVAAVSVLIIACPCAMGLATPTSIVVGTGRAAQWQVLFRRGDALQRLQDVDVVCFDKTGTLTEGRPVVQDMVALSGDADALLALVASAEQTSEHPLSQAILAEAKDRDLQVSTPQRFQALPGFGIEAVVDGREVLVGNARLMQDKGLSDAALHRQAEVLAAKGATPVFVAIDAAPAGLIAISDRLKPSAKATVQALQAQGREVVMISGDTRATAGAIGAELGLSDIIADVLPGQKADAVKTLQASGKTVAFVGDGINDAPALAQADVGIAIGSGTDIAIEAADVVLMSSDLQGVVNGFDISARTLRNIRQNLGWAFGYNALLIPVAAGVLVPFGGPMLSPMLAAGAMALSSVFVVTNALRLRWVTPATPVKGASS